MCCIVTYTTRSVVDRVSERKIPIMGSELHRYIVPFFVSIEDINTVFGTDITQKCMQDLFLRGICPAKESIKKLNGVVKKVRYVEQVSDRTPFK